MPETYWVFQRLGLLDQLAQMNFPRKVGVQFVNQTGRESQPFFFRSHDPRPSSETWHVDRAEFDHLLFRNAAHRGADCHTGVRVTDVKIESDRATGIVLTDAAGNQQQVAAKVVIDATGQQTLIASKLGLRRTNSDLKKAALWRHYRGGLRDESGGGVKTIILHASDKKTWFWYIPQANDLVSVGCVGDNDYLLKGRGSPEQTFAEELAKCQGVQTRLAQAEPSDPLKIDREFSYSTDRMAGDGWVLVGDAWGFIDPVYSSGVYFAMKSAELAADCIAEGLATGDTSAAQLGKWGDGFKNRLEFHPPTGRRFLLGRFSRWQIRQRASRASRSPNRPTHRPHLSARGQVNVRTISNLGLPSSGVRNLNNPEINIWTACCLTGGPAVVNSAFY